MMKWRFPDKFFMTCICEKSETRPPILHKPHLSFCVVDNVLVFQLTLSLSFEMWLVEISCRSDYSYIALPTQTSMNVLPSLVCLVCNERQNQSVMNIKSSDEIKEQSVNFQCNNENLWLDKHGAYYTDHLTKTSACGQATHFHVFPIWGDSIYSLCAI